MSDHNLLINRYALMLLALALLAGATILAGVGLRRASAQGLMPAALQPNGKIAFVHQHLYTVNPDGTGQTMLVESATEIRQPAWSPDGSKIVYARAVFPSQNSDLFVVNADGSNSTRLTHTADAATGEGSNYGPEWSPDGAKLVFVSTSSGNSDIWTMNADGSNAVNLTPNTSSAEVDADWSPDGTRIAFVSTRDFPNSTGDISRGFEIYTMNPDGTNITRLTTNQLAEREPTWSPSGDRLAFSRTTINGQTGAQNLDIYTMNPDGTGQTNITNHPSADFNPTWSPDGTRIAFGTFRNAVQNSNIELYMMDTDGGFQTRITNTTLEEREPDWGRLAAGATPTPTSTPTPFPPTPTPTPFQITGRVTDEAGNGLPGVNVILVTGRDGSRSVLTRPDGTYRHFYFPDTRITISPARDNTAFNPSNVTFVSSGNVTGDRPDVNFTGTFLPNISTFQFSTPTYAVNEGVPTATVTVTRTGITTLTGGALVSYRTVDDPAAIRCDAAGNTAYARCDYATGVDTLYFAAGETEKTLSISLINDAHVENAENFTLELFNATGATLGAQRTAVVQIADDDTPGRPNPIDDSRVFVRQQYLDFLSREPESAGFQAWLGVLDRCSNVEDNPDCDRATVSSSFFLSAEFRLKGYFVYRFYALSYGRMPRYDEIIPDMKSVSGASAAEVFSKRDAFAEGWVARPAFRNLYDAKTNADFVNTLLGRHGLEQITTTVATQPDGVAKVTLTRAGLIDSLNNQTRTRAQVVRAIVESDEVYAAQFNPAFVAMQYFGYLRRDPDPDYDKWLTYLNGHPDDHRTMVKGFVNSVEYRLRFGQP